MVTKSNAVVRFVTRVGHIFQRVEELLLSTSILTIAALTILNVVCRSAFNFSLAFTEEVSQFCIIIVCFVGLSYAAGKGRHIRMTAVYDQLAPSLRKTFMTVITTSTAAIMLTLSWFAAQYVVTVYELGGIYPALRVPFFAVYAIAPIGLFLAGVQYALAAGKNLASTEIYLSFERKDEYEEPDIQEL